MRTTAMMMVLVCMCALAGCSSNKLNPPPVLAPLQTVFDAKGCPVDLRLDNSCANVPHAPQDAVCRVKKQKIAWQAVDQTGTAIQTEFAVRFKPSEEILDSDSRDTKCSKSKNGLLKCKVKKGPPAETGKDYKYVVQVDDTECPVLDPRVYVN